MKPKADGDLHGPLETWPHPATQRQPPWPCQALARLVSRTALAYFAKPPCSGCQRGAGMATEEEQLLQSHQSYCKW